LSSHGSVYECRENGQNQVTSDLSQDVVYKKYDTALDRYQNAQISLCAIFPTHTFEKGENVSPHGGLNAFINKMYELCSSSSKLKKARRKWNEGFGEGSVVGNGWASLQLHAVEQFLLRCSVH